MAKVRVDDTGLVLRADERKRRRQPFLKLGANLQFGSPPKTPTKLTISPG